MLQLLPYLELKFDNTVSPEKPLSKPVDDVTGFAMEVDLKFTDKTKKVWLNFPFCPEKKQFLKFENTDYIKSTQLTLFIRQRN